MNDTTPTAPAPTTDAPPTPPKDDAFESAKVLALLSLVKSYDAGAVVRGPIDAARAAVRRWL